jgi:hypothetical protein
MLKLLFFDEMVSTLKDRLLEETYAAFFLWLASIAHSLAWAAAQE